MALTRVRMWAVGGLAVALLLAFAGWSFIVSPQRDKSADHWLELSAAEQQTTSLQARNTALEQQFSELDSARATLAGKQLALPESSQLDAFIRSLDEIAAQVGVAVEEVTALEPVDMSMLAGAGVVPAPTDTDTDTSEESTSTDETTTVTAAVQPVFVLPVTIRASGALADLQAFLEQLQSVQPRAVLVTNVSMVPNADSAALTDDTMLTADAGVFARPPVVATPTATPIE